MPKAKIEHPYDTARTMLLKNGRSLWIVDDKDEDYRVVTEAEGIFANDRLFVLVRVYEREPFAIESWDVFESVYLRNDVTGTLAALEVLLRAS